MTAPPPAAPPTTPPLAAIPRFIERRWPGRFAVVRGGDPREVARLVELARVALPPAYLRFLQVAGNEPPDHGLFHGWEMRAAAMIAHHEHAALGVSPSKHVVIGAGRDALGAEFLVLATSPGASPFELPMYAYDVGTDLDPELLVSAFFEDCVARELFEALVTATCRHRVAWTVDFSVEAYQRFEAEDPAPLVGEVLDELGLPRVNDNPHCAVYSDGRARHLSYRDISDTRFFVLQVGCHTAEQVAELRAAIERRLRLVLRAERPAQAR